MRRSLYSTKHAELTSAMTSYASSLSLNGLNQKTIIFPLRDDARIKRRVVIVNPHSLVLYDSSAYENTTGHALLLPHTSSALRGTDYFNFEIDGGTLISGLSTPIIRDGAVSGAVCLFETDNSMSDVFKTLRTTVYLVGMLIFICIVGIGFLLSRFYNLRISRLIHSMRLTRHDDAIDAIPLRKNDELAPIINEFNSIYEQLTYVQQMRRAFVSDASHELRTPLAAILLLCDSIAQTPDMDAVTMRDFMNDIIIEVERMSHTAEKLLELSKLDNRSRSGLAPISLTEVVRKMQAASEPLAIEGNVTIESYLEDDCAILGDIEGANQIVSNLIDNAIKYNRDGGFLRIYLFSKNGKCTLITDDTGIGIPKEHREQVFDRFYRIDKSRSRTGRGGSGLGLAIVKRNVESFGGTIKISDSAFGGTRFTLTFPSLLSDKEANEI